MIFAFGAKSFDEDLISEFDGRKDDIYVGYYNVVKLENKASKLFLSSLNPMILKKNDRQIVRGIKSGSLGEAFWLVLPPTNFSAYQGQPVKCGNEIRLLHMATKAMLASGEGDTDYSVGKQVYAESNDTPETSWKVLCSGKWDASQEVYFKNSLTGYYLNANEQIKLPDHEGGDFDIYASETKDNAQWIIDGGIFVDETEDTE